MTSLIFDQRPSGPEHYTQWFGTVTNDGPNLLCLTQVNIVMNDSAGTPLISVETFVEGFTYLTPDGLFGTRTCLGTGEEGMLWTNDFQAVATAASSFGTVDITFDPLVDDGTATKDPSPPGVTNIATVDNFGTADCRFKGTWQNGGNFIETPAVAFYLLNASGQIYDRLSAEGYDEILQPLDSWNFETDATDAAISDYKVRTDFNMSTTFAASNDPAMAALNAARVAEERAERQRHDAHQRRDGR